MTPSSWHPLPSSPASACACDDPRFCLLAPSDALAAESGDAALMPALLAKFGLAGLERIAVDADPTAPERTADALARFFADQSWSGAVFHPALQREAMRQLERLTSAGAPVNFSREALAAKLTDVVLRDSEGGLSAEHLGTAVLAEAARSMTATLSTSVAKKALLFTDAAHPNCAVFSRAALALAGLNVHEVRLRTFSPRAQGLHDAAAASCCCDDAGTPDDARALCCVDGEPLPKIKALRDAGLFGLTDAAEACLEASRAANACPDAVMAVNASAAGRFPTPAATPLPLLSRFPKLLGVCDLAGEPIRPRLLWDAQQRGLPAFSGFSLRIRWAKDAVETLLGRPMRECVARCIAADAELEARSLILIGMPGCGKTTIGKILAHKLMRRFVDVDELVSKRVGKPKIRIYQEDGEAFFREQETRAIAELALERGLVISTGGGSCLRPCNRMLLGLNGTFVWLRRPLSRLSTRDRPIAQERGVAALYEERAPIYAALADRTVDVTSVDDTVRAVLGEAC